MKKKSILILIGVIVITTCFLASGKDKKAYAKQNSFTSKDEIVNIIKTNQLEKYVSGRDVINSDEFNECLSERLRITGLDSFARVENLEEIELNNDERDTIIKYYQKMKKSYDKARPIEICETARFKGDFYRLDGYKMDGYKYMDVIFIDEGEGMVIDFINLDDGEHKGYRYSDD